MKKIVILFLGLFLMVACTNIEISSNSKKQAKKENFASTISYPEMKATVGNIRQKLKKQYQANPTNKTLDSISVVFSQVLVDSILPYWYKTEWTFEGHTDVPREGSVACGYLVSTSLKHMGLKLNRYKMAQQASKLEVESIAIAPSNVIFKHKPSLQSLAQLDVGLYIIGLDNHVGFFLRKPQKTLFIHSDYVSGQVTREEIQTSKAFRSEVYYLGKITGNRPLMKRWLYQEQVPIRLK